jgi:uncharacterized damage-inducible protein DinB
MQVSDYRNLLLHMEWADSRIWASALRVPALADDASLCSRLYHFHSTQVVYLQIFQSRPFDIPDLSTFVGLRAVGRWARLFYRELPDFRDRLDESRLSRNVEFPWAAQLAERFPSARPATIGECILQLALHTAHHRGQVVTRLREAGAEPPMTDFIAWIWMHEPAPDWGGLESE